MIKYWVVILLLSVITFSAKSQNEKMKEKIIYITKSDATTLIKDKNGILNTDESILPAMEVYYLNDGTVVVVKSYTKKAMHYINERETMGNRLSSQAGPHNLYENFQSGLENFPLNKDSIIKELFSVLGLQVSLFDTSDHTFSKITKAVKSYQKKHNLIDLLLGLTTLLGEQVINQKGGEWSLEKDGDIYFPVILTNDGKKNYFFSKILIDSLIGDEKFDWSIIVELAIQ